MTTTNQSSEQEAVLVGQATRTGHKQVNADAAAVASFPPARAVAAAVVDGIGHTTEAARLADVAAEVIARTAARSQPLAGVMAAAAMTADPTTTQPEPDATAVCARYIPDQGFTVSWVGNCRAWALKFNDTLVPLNVDHALGYMLRSFGIGEGLASGLDHQLRTTLSTATVATVGEVTEVIDTRLLLLTTNGLHTELPHAQITELVTEHRDTPQALADAVVEAATSGLWAENATAVALRLSPSEDQRRRRRYDDEREDRDLFADRAEEVR